MAREIDGEEGTFTRFSQEVRSDCVWWDLKLATTRKGAELIIQ